MRELALMHATIVARAGRVFRRRWLREHFAGEPWYRPSGFVETALTSIDRKNLEALSRYEASLPAAEVQRRLKDWEARQGAAERRAPFAVATAKTERALSAHGGERTSTPSMPLRTA